MTALVLALNPSIDAEWRVDQVLWEEKNNVRSERRWAGGKGINVARWLQHLGGEPRLLLPLGGPTGEELAGCLRAEKIPSEIIPLRGATRVNVIITTNVGRQMRFNPAGPKLVRADWAKLTAAVKQNLRSALKPAKRSKTASGGNAPGGLLILSGSLPQGIPVTAYAQLLRLAHELEVKTLLDCEGPALQAAVSARPFLVKPNDHELANWWGHPLPTEADVQRAAGALSSQTGGWVLVSRGAKRSLLVNGPENFQAWAAPRQVQPRNTVGAGDALLAAVAHAISQGAPPAQWLKVGLETGTAATQCLPGKLPR